MYLYLSNWHPVSNKSMVLFNLCVSSINKKQALHNNATRANTFLNQ